MRNSTSVTSPAQPIGPAASLARGCVSFVRPVATKMAASSNWEVKSAVSMSVTIGDKRTSRHHTFCVIVDSRREHEQGGGDAVSQPLRGAASREPVAPPVLMATEDEQVDPGAVSGQGLDRVPRPHVWRDAFERGELLARLPRSGVRAPAGPVTGSLTYMGSESAWNAESSASSFAGELTRHGERTPAVGGAVVGDPDRVERARPSRVAHGRHSDRAWSVL